mgnify:CR=1 FL=1
MYPYGLAHTNVTPHLILQSSNLIRCGTYGGLHRSVWTSKLMRQTNVEAMGCVRVMLCGGGEGLNECRRQAEQGKCYNVNFGMALLKHK